MEKHLLNILKEANTIIIPGLGALTITNGTTGEIMFMPYLKYDDGKLVGFIADVEGISTDEAKTKITQQVQTILDKLEANQSVSITGVGTFTKGADDFEFQYNNAAAGETIMPTVTEPEVQVEEIVSVPEITPEPIQEVIVQEPKTETPVIEKTEEIVNSETKEVAVEEEASSNTEIEQPKVDEKLDKAALKAKANEEKAAKALAIKEANEKIKAEKAAKVLAEKEAKAKAKADRKNKVVPEGEEGEVKPKKKKGILFWILMVVLLGMIGGGVHVAMNFDHYKEMIPFLHHKEDNNVDKSNEEDNTSIKEKSSEQNSEPVNQDIENNSENNNIEPIESTTVIEEKTEKKSETNSNGKFYIILGTFGEKVNAEGLAERVVMDGVSSASVIERNGSFSVVYNKFNTKDEAKTELEKARLNYPKAWVYTAE